MKKNKKGSFYKIPCRVFEVTLSGQTDRRRETYRVDQKNGTVFVYLITSPNITDFQNSFTVKIRRQFVMKLSLQIPPHLKCVATLPREISDNTLKPATPLTGCVINVDRAWHVAPKQLRLKFS